VWRDRKELRLRHIGVGKIQTYIYLIKKNTVNVKRLFCQKKKGNINNDSMNLMKGIIKL